jgi:hypothetical protein
MTLALYKGGWHSVPNYLTRAEWLLNNCALSEVVLLLHLFSLAKSRTHEVEVSNVKLMQLTGLNSKALYRARKKLSELGVTEAWPIDALKTKWRYKLAQELDGSATEDTTSAGDVEDTDARAQELVRMIPRERLLALLDVVPSLAGNRA